MGRHDQLTELGQADVLKLRNLAATPGKSRQIRDEAADLLVEFERAIDGSVLGEILKNIVEVADRGSRPENLGPFSHQTPPRRI